MSRFTSRARTRALLVLAGLALLACGKDGALTKSVTSDATPGSPEAPAAAADGTAEYSLEAFAEEAEDQPRFGRAREGLPSFGGVESRDEPVMDADFPGQDINLDPTGELVTDGRDHGVNFVAGSPGFHSEAPFEGPDSTRKTAAASGRPTTWKRSTIVPNTSRLRVGETEELPLDVVEASIRVDGFRARIVLDCLFRNDREETLEGTFELRLPNEASPFYFAFGESPGASMQSAPAVPAEAQGIFLGSAAVSERATAPGGIADARRDVWSGVREARMVPRERGAWAYTETTRRRVDPALVEWSGAGVFSARVFPLAPGKAHRVVFAYDADLVPTGDDLEFRFDLPPGVPRRAVTLSIAGGTGETLVPPTAPESQGSPGGRRTYSFRDPADAAIVLRVAKPGATLLHGSDPATGPCFAAMLRPDIPDAGAAAPVPRAVFLVDTSLSSNAERFPVWLRLVREVLDRNRGSLREFSVLFFDVSPRWWREGFVANTPDNVEAFLKDAGELSLAGATDLRAALAEASAPAWRPRGGRAQRHDLFLLSDGAATWGAASRADLDVALSRGAAGAVWAYQTGLPGTDSATLAHLANRTGGAVFAVTGESEIAAAATAHARRPCVLRGVSIDGASDVLIAGRPTAVHAGQVLRIVGRGAPAATADIVLHLEQGGRAFDVRTTPARVVPSDLAARVYGQIAVGQIEESADLADSPARAYAQHFRVVGSTCSLLMLESEADYERFGIHPENDAARVRSEKASEFVVRAEDARSKAANDPRADLVAWLRSLETFPGLEFKLRDGLLGAIAGMPETSFDRNAAALTCKRLRWSDVSGKLREGLVARDLDYDTAASEAERLRTDASAGSGDALRMLSSLVENRPGDTALARDVAFHALDWGLPDQAVGLLQRVARLRPYEPETYRGLADAFARTGNGDLALVWSEIALAGNFDRRFGGFHEIAAYDAIRFLRRCERGDAKTSVPEYAASRLRELTQEFLTKEPALVVVISWNTDRTDVDLHVTDPKGEECWYKNAATAIGGRLTADVTEGYGPEMFVLPDPVPGDYVVRVHYFASDRVRASVRSQVLATIYERWGRPDERVTRKVVTLRVGNKESEDVEVVRVAR